ncbi:type VI secretion system protein TssA [Vitiosangium sp. GDMCC 1.1324]|uniref:type VI secretion system protein TssA n=1 Tax=Vitiosangium sp. (strain GDMCC 1.1324) TaxID=2138576 RepID=UPI000D39F28C|nr:type VI secretion system protein TssA [Vitiosangium sp. GDMCC 1.1324]PTL82646.1 type VI secretion system protein TssA [Vitiosangium sp. GDMCC 1.1324]
MDDMNPASPLDLEPILRPISPDAPSGRSLRYEPLYDQIREARREDDPSLPQGVWQTSLKRANWAQVTELCQQALAHESKDLQLATWLTEAWGIQQGFPGVAQGLSLTTALVDRFWDSLWPALEDEDAEARLAPLAWLDDKLPLVLGKVPLVKAQTPGGVSIDFAAWQRILHREKHQGAGQDESSPEKAGASSGPLNRETFLASAALMPAPALDMLARGVDAALAASSALEQALDSRLGRTSAALRRTRSTLGDLQTLVSTLRANTPREEPGAGVEAPLDTAVADMPSVPGRRSGAIRSREEAYQMLALASDYLRRTEPHSPVAYLVKRAVSWGQMPLAQLLSELVPDSSNLEAIQSLLGMKKAE